MSFDGYNLTMDEIRVLVGLGDNPTEAELAVVGVSVNSNGTWSIFDAKMFEEAKNCREIRVTSADIAGIWDRVHHRQELIKNEKRKGS